MTRVRTGESEESLDLEDYSLSGNGGFVMRRKKLVIVEDDADICLGYQILLQDLDYQLFFAEDAAVALSVACKELPDLIILDLGLPAGDGGFQLLEKLADSAELKLVPVIVISARDHQRAEERALKAGARAYLQKPWDDAELLALIRHLLLG
jgi:DNA-binding response OmpR family regulator